MESSEEDGDDDEELEPDMNFLLTVSTVTKRPGTFSFNTSTLIVIVSQVADPGA